MQSDEFRSALEALIAGALIARGWTVLDIMGTGKPRPHAFTEFGRVRDGTVIYPEAALF